MNVRKVARPLYVPLWSESTDSEVPISCTGADGDVEGSSVVAVAEAGV